MHANTETDTNSNIHTETHMFTHRDTCSYRYICVHKHRCTHIENILTWGYMHTQTHAHLHAYPTFTYANTHEATPPTCLHTTHKPIHKCTYTMNTYAYIMNI